MKMILSYLEVIVEKGGSDIYFTTDAIPSMKLDGKLQPLSERKLEAGETKEIAYELMTESQIKEFEEKLEMNFAISKKDLGRFRLNVFFQRGEVSIVIRYIKSLIPDFKQLCLPSTLEDIMSAKKGLVLVVGSTDSGKSTTLASMMDYRNMIKADHILTIEDPIEFVFEHKKSIVNQREVGLDTLTYEDALREALREAPDVIMIGEVRDKDTMESCVAFADTGHLCLSTLHAVNANQALDRVINLFPAEAKNQILMDLSLNLKAIISQRLVNEKGGGRVAAVEVMINNPFISELILKDRIHDIKDAMAKGADSGMVTFDQSLYNLFKKGKIDLETALENADSRSDLEWKMNFGGGSTHLSTDVEKLVDLEFPKEIGDLE